MFTTLFVLKFAAKFILPQNVSSIIYPCVMYLFSNISAAIAAEKKIQRDTIRKQRDDYIRRANALKRELITLKEQREEMVAGNAPPSPTTNGFIKENDRLQVITNPILESLSCNTSCTFRCIIFRLETFFFLFIIYSVILYT